MRTLPLTLEERVVLLACLPPSPNSVGLGAALTEDPAWAEVAGLAIREKVLAPAWAALKEHEESLPPEVLDGFRSRTNIVEFRMDLTQRLCHRVVSRLNTLGHPVLLLKGAALGHTVYPSFRDRPMGDLDILLPPDAAGPAWRALREDGWTLEPEHLDGFFEDHHHLHPLEDPQGLGLFLEVHTTLLDPGCPARLDDEDLWGEARSVRVGDHEALVLAPHHQLIYLSLHLMWGHSLDHGLVRAVRDLAAVIHRDEPDWVRLLEATARCGAVQLVYWPLRLTRSLTNAPVPEHVLTRLRPRLPGPVLDILERWYIRGALGEYPSVRFGQILWNVGVAGSGLAADIRPWDRGARWRQEGGSSQEPMAVRQRLRKQFGGAGLRRWIRFLRAAIRGSGSRGDPPG